MPPAMDVYADSSEQTQLVVAIGFNSIGPTPGKLGYRTTWFHFA